MPPPGDDDDALPAPPTNMAKSKSKAAARSGPATTSAPSAGKDAFLSMMDPAFLAAAGIGVSRTPQQAASSINPDLKLVDTKSTSGRNCAACNKSLAGIEGIHALNKNWHAACWVCFQCRKQLGQRAFVTRSERPFCDDVCSMKAICGGCKKLLGKVYTEALGRRYHAGCFRCTNCSRLLNEETYTTCADDSTRPYCEVHGDRS